MDFKILRDFNISTADIPQSGGTRSFNIQGEVGLTFSLEVKNEDAEYYNFTTGLFQVKKVGLLDVTLESPSYSGTINFPGVTDADMYTFSLHINYAEARHANHVEVRRADGSYDVNLSTGSNSSLLQRIIYQTLDKTIAISSYSPLGMAGSSGTTQNITATKSQSLPKVSFSITATAANTSAFQLNRDPLSIDAMAFVSRVVGASPTYIASENTFPTATVAFTGDDINGAITSGAVVRMDNTDLSAVIAVGDKITTTVMTDTVNGVVTSGIKVVMDNTVAGKMAVGDQITGNAFLNANLVTVAVLNPDGNNDSEFSMSEAVAIEDGATLSFSSKINRSLTTVTVVETSGVATDFTMSQDVQFRDNTPLTFYNKRNYSWPVDSISGLKKGMRVVADPASNGFTSGTEVGNYNKTILINEGEVNEFKIIEDSRRSLESNAVKPVITTDATSFVTTIVQSGSITFTNQALATFGGTTVKVYAYGESSLKNLTGYDIVLSNLKAVLTPVIATTTAASAGGSSVNVVVDSRNGILDDVSTVSGIGIDPSVLDPTVDSGAGAVSGAGTIVLTAAQSLESGAILTFANAGSVVTITGDILINDVGNENVTIRFDLDKFLSYA